LQRLVALAALFCIVMAVNSLLVGRRLDCPQCSADLAKLRGRELRPFEQRYWSWWSGGWIPKDPRPFWKAWDRCPRCRMSFETPYLSH
jgi:hypothetical protein